MGTALANILMYALQIGAEKYKSRYLDEVIDLKTRLQDELKKDPANRYHNVIDNIDDRLRIIADELSNFGRKNS